MNAEQAEPTYGQFQAAHYAYLQDIGVAWGEVQNRFLTLQIDYQRAVEQSKEQKDIQAAQENYKQECIAAWQQTTKRSDDAYVQYKSAIQKAMASANPEKLDFTTLTSLSQSLYLVSQRALQLSMLGSTGASTSPVASQ
jgi:uncharacterized membrane-anchored protein YhcB (DUF1043 family)